MRKCSGRARAKFFKADPGGPVAAASRRRRHPSEWGTPTEGREMLPEWTPSQKADVALRMFPGHEEGGADSLCAETAEKYES